MAIQSKVSLPVIKRLPKYYRYLTTLSADGKEKISSSELAHMMGTTASQVRQDFNCFGGFGQQGIGYKVDVLRAEIGKLLFGDGEKLPTILIGAGRLGSAVSSFISRDTNGYKLIGVFDINPELCGKEMGGATIYPLSELEAFCAEHHPTVGGDVEAGLALAELIAGVNKPSATLVLGGGHSIGIPLAVSARRSFIVPTATMTVHPVRHSGMVLGVPQTLRYFEQMQERIVGFVVSHSKITARRFTALMHNTGELVMDWPGRRTALFI